ncbi:MAG: alpha/beta fold hydrolase [Actinobacteria bacterium]|nr:alpha/beta fold hydrolase [Actinomycetota bacterium]
MSDRYPVIDGAEAWSSEGTGANAAIGVAVVHGFSGNPNSTRPLGVRLAEDGYTVEVPRLPGHGTHWRDMSRYRYADWRGTVHRLVDDLQRRCEQVVLVGLSMGGLIALDETARRCRSGQHRIAGVVTINAPVLNVDSALAKLNPILQYVIPVAPRDLAGLPSNDIAKEGADERAYAMVPAKAGYSVQREYPRIRRRLEEVDVPLLVMQAEQDHTVPVTNADAIVEHVGSQDVERASLERSYHVATLDHDADLIAERVRDFIGRVTS